MKKLLVGLIFGLLVSGCSSASVQKAQLPLQTNTLILEETISIKTELPDSTTGAYMIGALSKVVDTEQHNVIYTVVNQHGVSVTVVPTVKGR